MFQNGIIGFSFLSYLVPTVRYFYVCL
ncbi:unnamed protein product, partial [Vitis vinifera]|uniref:Uncharacterized protein n=1 Tax=Vitis vinifera TaxID=29760 RepID=D7UE97_VITVI